MNALAKPLIIARRIAADQTGRAAVMLLGVALGLGAGLIVPALFPLIGTVIAVPWVLGTLSAGTLLAQAVWRRQVERLACSTSPRDQEQCARIRFQDDLADIERLGTTPEVTEALKLQAWRLYRVSILRIRQTPLTNPCPDGSSREAGSIVRPRLPL